MGVSRVLYVSMLYFTICFLSSCEQVNGGSSVSEESVSEESVSNIVVTIVNNDVEVEYPRVQHMELNDRIFHGTLDGHGSFTLFLQLRAFREMNYGFRMIEGWYYDDDTPKVKRPLIGVWDAEGFLLLSYDTTRIKEDTFFDVGGVYGNVFDWVKYDSFNSWEDYNEKIHYSNEKLVWIKGEDTLTGKLYNQDKWSENVMYGDDYEIYQEKDYLLLDSINAFDLRSVGRYRESMSIGSFKLLAYSKDTYILKYNFMRNLNMNGQCGGGEKSGYLKLVFKPNNKLKDFEMYDYSSCGLIEILDEKKVNEYVTEYTCEHGWSSDKDIRTLTVDLKNLTLKEIKK